MGCPGLTDDGRCESGQIEKKSFFSALGTYINNSNNALECFHIKYMKSRDSKKHTMVFIKNK